MRLCSKFGHTEFPAAQEEDVKSCEYWKAIPDIFGFEASTHGRIRRVTTTRGAGSGHVYVGDTSTHGYRRVKLGGRRYFIANLVMLAFIGPKIEGYNIHHIDGDKTNDWLYNLEYISSRLHTGQHSMGLTREEYTERLQKIKQLMLAQV